MQATKIYSSTGRPSCLRPKLRRIETQESEEMLHARLNSMIDETDYWCKRLKANTSKQKQKDSMLVRLTTQMEMVLKTRDKNDDEMFIQALKHTLSPFADVRQISASKIHESLYLKGVAFSSYEIQQIMDDTFPKSPLGGVSCDSFIAKVSQYTHNSMQRKAGTQIQAVMRGHASRSKAYKQKKSAVIIQKIIRGAGARTHLDNAHRSAACIQSLYRGNQQKQVFRNVKSNTIKFQSRIRGQQARQLKQQKIDSSVTIQSHIRKQLEQKKYKKKRTNARTIEAMARCYLVRQDFLSKKKALIQIQQLLRKYDCRNKYLQKKRSCVLIQSVFRGSQCRQKLTEVHSGAITIQCAIRSYLARIRTNNIREKSELEEIESFVEELILRVTDLI